MLPPFNAQQFFMSSHLNSAPAALPSPPVNAGSSDSIASSACSSPRGASSASSQARKRELLQKNKVRDFLSAFENNSNLHKLLSEESSHPLVLRLMENQEGWKDIFPLDLRKANGLETAIERLSRHYPNLITILDRSPAILNELSKYCAVLETVLEADDPSIDSAEEPFLQKIALLNIAEELQQQLKKQPEEHRTALKEKHDALQTEWMTAILGTAPGKNEDPDIGKTISLLECGGKTMFASGCPRKEIENLKNFLTLAAKNNMVILALVSEKDFEKYPHMEKYFEVGDHEYGEIKWSSRDLTTDKQREKWKNLNGFNASCYELTITLGEGKKPRKARVIRCERWPDRASVPLAHVDQLLDEVDLHIAAGSPSGGETESRFPRSLVHCALGVERTTVFAAIDILRQASKNNKKISVEEIVEMLRIGRGSRDWKPFGQLDQLRMVVEYALDLGQPIFKEGKPASLIDARRKYKTDSQLFL